MLLPLSQRTPGLHMGSHGQLLLRTQSGNRILGGCSSVVEHLQEALGSNPNTEKGY